MIALGATAVIAITVIPFTTPIAMPAATITAGMRIVTTAARASPGAVMVAVPVVRTTTRRNPTTALTTTPGIIPVATMIILAAA
jgi:hypothetical protein